MKLSILALFCLLAIAIMPELVYGQPAGQRRQAGRKQAAPAPIPRGGRKLSPQSAKLKKTPALRRRGKQDDGAAATEDAPPAPPAPMTDAEAAAAAEAGEVPAWCDPTKEMGAWLNFVKMRKWCADHGFTSFGPYGGVPAEGEAADATAAEGEEAAPAEGAEETA